jgi:hypothetical protein
VTENRKDEHEWIATYVHLAKTAWQDAVLKMVDSTRSKPSYPSATLLAYAGSDVMLIASSDDPCENPHQELLDSWKLDPTEGSATPGNTGKQRLLPSAASSSEEQDSSCDQVTSLKKGVEGVLKEYTKNLPQQGEDGYEYAKRIERKFGYTPGGDVKLMRTTEGCAIDVNIAYYKDKPRIIFEADCAHEKVHQATCRWARDHYTGGYFAWMMNPSNYQQNEIDAYKAGIKVLDDWLKKNGCK